MPLYDFECESCGKSFEELIRGADESATVICEHCGSGKVERKISSFHAAAGSASAPDRAGAGGCGSGCACH